LQIFQEYPLVIVDSLTCGFQLEENEDEEDEDSESEHWEEDIDMCNNLCKHGDPVTHS
jgi:hypothetical protein